MQMVTIMGIPVVALTVSLLLGAVTALPSHSTVFLEKQEASAVISRHKRANVGDEETQMPANLERECVEEVCNYEEAREIFQDTYRTDIFWAVYVDGDQCADNPCKNGAFCSDSVGGYDCVCKSGFSGDHCETDNTTCIVDETKGCDQFCKPGYLSYECSCASGWKQNVKDKNKCIPDGDHPCGKVDNPRLATVHRLKNNRQEYAGLSCESTDCPWQALLLAEDLTGFCGGVILKENLILTTAQCATKNSRFRVAVGKKIAANENDEQILSVNKVTTHPLFKEGRAENDLAVVELGQRMKFKKNVMAVCLPERDFADSVLMTHEHSAVITGWRDIPEESTAIQGNLTLNHLKYEPLVECRARHSGLVTNKMFCTAPRAKADCTLGPGSAALTLYREVYFLTGVVSKVPGHNCQQGYIFQKVSRFLPWLQTFMA
ncbi:hypothetical protein GJAV_G00222170 [Gymnothorax javanicus]|nr:hypothetical protein GJAV_G00222170 [Gymnothorax javanicus]